MERLDPGRLEVPCMSADVEQRVDVAAGRCLVLRSSNSVCS
jgi:hypothetical protein